MSQSINIRDHWSQFTITNRITIKKFEIFPELTKCDTETWCEQMLLGKWCRQTCSMQAGHKLSICKKPSIFKAQYNEVCLYAVSCRQFTKSYSLTCEKFISIFYSFFLETTKLSAQSLRILARLWKVYSEIPIHARRLKILSRQKTRSWHCFKFYFLLRKASKLHDFKIERLLK